MIEIGERINISINRREAHFDRACDAAYCSAVSMFGVDDYGHSNKVIGWSRSDCSIVTEFEKYTRIDDNHIYKFIAYVEKAEDV